VQLKHHTCLNSKQLFLLSQLVNENLSAGRLYMNTLMH